MTIKKIIPPKKIPHLRLQVQCLFPGPHMFFPKGPSNSIVFTFGAQTSTKYLLYWYWDPLGMVLYDMRQGSVP